MAIRVDEFKRLLEHHPEDATLEIELYTGNGTFKYVDLDEFNIRSRRFPPVEPSAQG